MDLPICDICAKTGVLCSVCETKLQRGQISELDVEVSKALYGIGVEGIGFERAIDTKNFVIILTKKEDIGKIIGKNGDNLRLLSRKLGKKVRVIGTENMRDTIYDFVAPAQITAINTVYMPDGNIIRRIKINKKDKKKLRMDIKEIERLISSLSNDRVEISFE
ncbi:MAG: transcription elongation factor NusA [Candidatus Altiarchaeales archaeon]|nr:MAG: transcription elongation factor NusA [Candidatus Altiarchaeales archaeon]